MKKNNQNGAINIIAIILIIVVIAAIIFAVLYFTDYKRTKLTAENFESVMDEASNELDEDERAYLAYSGRYYMISDGLSNLNDEDAAYQNIYDKTVQDLIDEGKDLMEEEGITPEEFTESLTDLESYSY